MVEEEGLYYMSDYGFRVVLNPTTVNNMRHHLLWEGGRVGELRRTGLR